MPQRTFTPTKDNYLEGAVGQQSMNHGTAATIVIKKTATLDNRGLFEFDVTPILGSQIISATLSMEVETLATGTMPFQIDRLVRVGGASPWSETLSSWNEVTTSVSWTTVGAAHDGDDNDSTYVITGTMPGSQSGRYTFGTVTTFVQDALDSRAGLSGFRLIQTSNKAGQVYTFHSREATDPLTRPRLVVDYTHGHRNRIHGLPRTPYGFEDRR